jgi:hypothetical protein
MGPHIFFNINFVKNHNIDNNSTTKDAKENTTTYLEILRIFRKKMHA